MQEQEQLPTVPHQNWFAVALSHEVQTGGVIGVPFMQGRLALFRRDDGSVVALSASCAHMGADLAAGDVVDGTLRCMFHHFTYGADGVCTSIPSGGRVPSTARVHSFPVAEAVGLVWVFNGEAPPCGPPQVPGDDAGQLAVRARRTDVFGVAPWVIITNSFDFAHLRYVHGLKFDFDESTIRWGDREVAYEMTFSMPDGLVAHQRIRVAGTNTVSYVTGGDVDSMGLFTSTPVGTGSQGCCCRSTSPTSCSKTTPAPSLTCASSRAHWAPTTAASSGTSPTCAPSPPTTPPPGCPEARPSPRCGR
jgi:phenylpropionate dioxygenase-like ring-hydroxylating dioxygenase large terminal subunit